MTRWPRLAQIISTCSLLVLGLACLPGCADDLYASCELDPDDPYMSSCLADDGEQRRSCVVEQQLQCETRICGKYQGSDAFCTIACSDDGDCPNGVCREFVFQSGSRYCVETNNVD